MKILFLACFFFIFNGIFCQTADLWMKAPVTVSKADSLIKEIRKLQIKKHPFYEPGQFPAQRGKHRREDNTIFFSALISFTLNGIYERVEDKTKSKLDSICSDISAVYKNYQNQSTGLTYNFWKTKPALFFPNSKFLSHHTRFQLPDDADCTAIIYLTDPRSKSPEMLQLQLKEHANKGKKKIKNTLKKYRNFKAYSTWFGKNMPIEFDICVQSNVLYFIYKNQLTLTSQDSATILLLKEQILSGDYLRYAHYLSPSYKKRSIILYHLARLLEKNEIPQLENCKTIIREDIQNELKKKNEYMDEIILSTALMRMNGTPLPVSDHEMNRNELETYVFFHANIFSSYIRPWMSRASRTSVFKYNFYCKAYCLALLAEYHILASYRHQENILPGY